MGKRLRTENETDRNRLQCPYVRKHIGSNTGVQVTHAAFRALFEPYFTAVNVNVNVNIVSQT